MPDERARPVRTVERVLDEERDVVPAVSIAAGALNAAVNDASASRTAMMCSDDVRVVNGVRPRLAPTLVPSTVVSTGVVHDDVLRLCDTEARAHPRRGSRPVTSRILRR